MAAAGRVAATDACSTRLHIASLALRPHNSRISSTVRASPHGSSASCMPITSCAWWTTSGTDARASAFCKEGHWAGVFQANCVPRTPHQAAGAAPSAACKAQGTAHALHRKVLMRCQWARWWDCCCEAVSVANTQLHVSTIPGEARLWSTGEGWRTDLHGVLSKALEEGCS